MRSAEKGIASRTPSRRRPVSLMRITWRVRIDADDALVQRFRELHEQRFIRALRRLARGELHRQLAQREREVAKFARRVERGAPRRGRRRRSRARRCAGRISGRVMVPRQPPAPRAARRRARPRRRASPALARPQIAEVERHQRHRDARHAERRAHGDVELVVAVRRARPRGHADLAAIRRTRLPAAPA